MLLTAGLLLLCTAISNTSPLQQPLLPQNVLDLSHASSQEGNPRKLRGKFLHITDIHPDPFYRQGTDPDGDHPCHAGHGRAGYFGAEKTECDTPFSLVNATFDWIKHNVKDDIDFVLWTGDSARHDNDERHSRTRKGVEELNRFIVTKFDEVFGKPDHRNDPDPTNDFIIPIVPTFGNNDILPHNIFEPGPNKWTRKYLSIWDKFIPQEQRHNFARGGWFFTEVIPNRLAVFSLNTLYFFDSNAAVDGCDASSEPGYEHFEWLRIQLEFLRQRKMKAILMGHVPPARTESKQNWDESCYQKYTLWLRQYRDVIVGNVFGHMNIDHFILQDVRELTYPFKIRGIDDEGIRNSASSLRAGYHTQAKSDYLSDLRLLWRNLPSPPNGLSYMETDIDYHGSIASKRKKKRDKFLKDIGGPFGERFSLSVVSPSVVPNFYPTLRIIEYNITGLKHDHPALRPTAPAETDLIEIQFPDIFNDEAPVEDPEGGVDFGGDEYEVDKKKKKKKHKKKKGKKPTFPVPKPPSKSSPPGPGYSPQPLSFVAWKQLYANLTKINEAVAKELNQHELTSQVYKDQAFREEVAKKHFFYELEYDTKNDTVRPLKDLTMRSWLDYAEKISRIKYSPASELPDFDFGVSGPNMDPQAEMTLDDNQQDISHDSQTERDDLKHDLSKISEDEAFLGNAKSDPGMATTLSFPYHLEAVDDDSRDADGEEEQQILLECLTYLWKLKNAGISKYNPDDHDPWFSRLFQRINQDLASMHCSSVNKYMDTFLQRDSPDSKQNGDDSGYESDPGSDSDDEIGNSAYDSSGEEDGDVSGDEDEGEDEDEDEGEDINLKKNKKQKCKGKHKKKCKKRKGESLKKNHLWHHFVRRAFVGTKSWEDLLDEFG